MKIIKYSLAISVVLVSFLRAQTYAGNVGIGTDDPKNTLDIRGDLKLTPDEVTKEMNITPLYIADNATEGEKVIVSKAQSENVKLKKPFLFFQLLVKLRDKEKTEVDYNTRIPAEDYNLFVVNSQLLQQKNSKPSGITHTINSGSRHINQNPIKQVDTYVDNAGFWHVSAKYPAAIAITADGSNLNEWLFSFMATSSKNSQIVDPNPNYNPKNVYDGGTADTSGEGQSGRHYSKYEPSNPQNPTESEPHSLRGDSYKLNSNMTGSADVDPLLNY